MSAPAQQPDAGRPGRLARLRDRLSGRIAFGADYNPEQWPPDTWADDARLMAEAGVNLVSLGIFSWSQLEPAPGRFEFGWLDRVIDLLWSSGVAVCLATATASPPPWLTRLHPGILPVRADGTRLWPGSRQHYCPSSPAYLDAALALVDRLARHYGDHPALALWHVGNEYGCHVPACYCDVSAEAFRSWLGQRYQDVGELNEAWSTRFWSQQYDDIAEVLPPRASPTFGNPAHQLDYARFSSEALERCFRAEVGRLREITPEVPVTTNFMGFFKPLDYWRWARHEDIVSHDSYPDPADAEPPATAAMAFDLMRSLHGGAPWLLMEQAPSAVNWRPVNMPKPPGVMRAWSYQAIAHGADGIMYFQWRASRGGAEKFHSAMVPHAGPDSRVFREVRQLGAELNGLSELTGSRVQAELAIALDWESWWALELDAHPSSLLSQTGLAGAVYRPLWEAHIPVDFVHPAADLSRYRALIVPGMYLAGSEATGRIAAYAAAGGHVLVTFFSGIVDECDRVRLGGYPGGWRDLLGIRVTEFRPLPPGLTATAEFAGGGETFTCSAWQDDLELAGATVLASVTSGPGLGAPALTRCAAGRGSAWYLPTLPDPAGLTAVIRAFTAGAGVSPACPGIPPGVEVMRRRGAAASYLIACNLRPDEAVIPWPSPGRELLSGKLVGSRLVLPGAGVAVVREDQPPSAE
jgi:beta-galactosidase